MKKCNFEGCANEGTEVRDYSYGPLGGYSYYCKDHVAEADLKESVAIAERNFIYVKSVAANALAEYQKSNDKLIDANERVILAKIKLNEARTKQ